MTDLDGRLGARQIQGDRDYQEDDFGISHMPSVGEEGEHILLVLADGMGGHVAGATASALAVRRFVEAIEERAGSVAERLKFALDSANNEIQAAIAKNPDMAGMGCTLVGVSITAAGLQWVSVGDSPLWIYSKGKLERLNDDHSMAPVIANLVEAGHLTPEEAANDKRKNALRSAVMGEEIELVDLQDEPVGIEPEARILLASDGLDTLQPDEIAAILKQYAKKSARETVAALIAGVEAKAKPGQDNTTVLLFEPGGVISSDEDSMKPEDVNSIVRRAKGLTKGEREHDPRTIPGDGRGKQGSRPPGLVAIIVILLAALVGALAWIFLSEPEIQKEPTPPPIVDEGLEEPAGRSVAEPVEATAGKQEAAPEEPAGQVEPVVEAEERPAAPVPETAPVPEARRREEAPVEAEELPPAEAPAVVPSGGEGGAQQPTESPPEDPPESPPEVPTEVIEGGESGAVAPGPEKEAPTTGSEAAREGIGEKEKKDEEEKEDPPPEYTRPV